MSTTAQQAVFQLDALMAEVRPIHSNRTPYHEFLWRESMSAGIHRFAAGEPDRQSPHTEDEVYYVLDGHGAIEIDGERSPVGRGSVLCVPRLARHRFVD